MPAVYQAAMFKAVGVTGKHQRRQLLRHLQHHFGKNSFEPEHKVQMLCEGHTPVLSDNVLYAYKEGTTPEVIEFQQKTWQKKSSANSSGS